MVYDMKVDKGIVARYLDDLEKESVFILRRSSWWSLKQNDWWSQSRINGIQAGVEYRMIAPADHRHPGYLIRELYRTIETTCNTS